MLKEFRHFLLRGNIVELAVAFIAGIVFNAVVQSLVNDVLMQVVAAIFGEPDFSRLTVTLNGSEIRYGAFLTALVNFLLTMAAVFFFLVKPMNSITERFDEPDEASGPTQRECPECLAEVPARATRCRFCTTVLEPAA